MLVLCVRGWCGWGWEEPKSFCRSRTDVGEASTFYKANKGRVCYPDGDATYSTCLNQCCKVCGCITSMGGNIENSERLRRDDIQNSTGGAIGVEGDILHRVEREVLPLRVFGEFEIELTVIRACHF